MIQWFFKTLYIVFLGAFAMLALLLLTSIVPIPGNIETKIVQSGSMEPAIHTGSLVILRPEESYEVGDIVTFGRDDKDHVPVTHRIVEKETGDGAVTYTTKGDANEDPDPNTLRKNEVIGKVLFSLPYVGYLLDFAKTPIGFGLLIGIPALFVIYDEVLKIVAEVRKKPQVEEKKDNETTS